MLGRENRAQKVKKEPARRGIRKPAVAPQRFERAAATNVRQETKNQWLEATGRMVNAA